MLWFLAHLPNGMANKADEPAQHLMAQMPHPSTIQILSGGALGEWAYRINSKHGKFAL